MLSDEKITNFIPLYNSIIYEILYNMFKILRSIVYTLVLFKKKILKKIQSSGFRRYNSKLIKQKRGESLFHILFVIPVILSFLLFLKPVCRCNNFFIGCP